MRLSVVVPCFNEEGNIACVVAQAAEVGRRLATELEIIVVDDGSTDDTARVITEQGQAMLVSLPFNLGSRPPLDPSAEKRILVIARSSPPRCGLEPL